MISLFLDTNILVDFLCHREPFYKEAEQLFTMSYAGRISMSISALSFINAVYISKKYQYKTSEVIQNLRQIARFTHITGLNESTVKEALDSYWPDFEDAVQYFSAQLGQVDYIITRNPKDFKNASIPVYTPTEFLAIPFWLEDTDTPVLNEPEVEYKKQK